jgi:methylmalonyl-CoA/ethylmalonyl-CoA epimerase
MRGYPIDHIGAAVGSLDDAIPLFEQLLGARASDIHDVPHLGLRLCFVGSFELLEPTAPDTLLGRMVAERATHLHHIAYRVPRIEEAMAAFVADGFDLLDVEPRTGANGHRIAFLHPGSTAGLLLELVERAE